jgi:hypothetical protein
MRYRLRTLLIVLAIGPPVLAGGYWAWKEWTRPPKWAEFLNPANEPYGFAATIPGTTPAIVAGAEDRPPGDWGITPETGRPRR